MRVYFNSGEVIEGHRAPVKRAIKRRLKDDPHLQYRFRDTFTELDVALYDLRSGFISWFQDNYTSEVQRMAVKIEYRRLGR